MVNLDSVSGVGEEALRFLATVQALDNEGSGEHHDRALGWCTRPAASNGGSLRPAESVAISSKASACNVSGGRHREAAESILRNSVDMPTTATFLMLGDPLCWKESRHRT
jgi:hypothetical protein